MGEVGRGDKRGRMRKKEDRECWVKKEADLVQITTQD